MKGHGIPTDQYEKYIRSVHGVALLKKGDLSAPACNDCHGNHGAAPPGVADITMVCGTCHGREGELFGQSVMAAEMKKIPSTRGCVTCHGNHGIQHPTDDLLSAGQGGACASCHAPGSECAAATDSIAGGVQALKRQVASADSLLASAELLGMDASLGREKLRGASDQLIGARAVLHSFDKEKITGALTAGFAEVSAAHDLGRAALRDWRVRRVGLAASLVVILGLIFLLVRWIRALEAEQARKGGAPQ
jgi:predicted CXXCH cytochrome family protein